ncbi:hypothetical protein CLU93_4617 [Janthinobacterium sp. 35]|uniref:S53 family peptidase n=1 Tax=Janthinobacterium sp. 35 TaxID=2035210 RepID=UPI000C174B61|nr:S53 family peptidase [Janthinobacterium sp. 35]PIG30281.1 hypothetical protein CLU93_4617 [Janthinobacterium sp. 35]
MKKFNPLHPRQGRLLLGATAALLLGACGPGQETSAPPAAIATAATQFTVEVPVIPAAVGALVAQPMFHAAPMLLDAPDGRDSGNSSGSAHWRPHMQRVPGTMAEMSTRRLTAQKIAAAEQTAQNIAPLLDGGAADIAAPMAGSSVMATYSPAQIRAAYDLPALPAAGTALTPAQAAQLGAGQTIYIVDAMHNPNAAAELAIFNQKFGLPACTTKAIATNATLPLPPASTSGCEFSVVYNTPSSTMTATAPAYNSGWAMEIALDVQWAHATAPLARIVLIEAPDASVNSLLGAVRLANLMGPGVVSMSFGAVEGNWTASVDSAFTGKNMTYLAATGDSGSSVSWPSVSPNVLAVGGTTLSYSGTGTRSEAAWSGTGGGISAYTALPSYQSASNVPGMTGLLRRNVADVAFNADPATGQYTAVMAQGSSTASWLSIGGTSLSTPQWAGLIAIANASRALQAKTALGLAHTTLYGQIATVPGTFASSFADITRGSNGTCSVCTARVGYDPLAGLGTPNVKSLLASLSGMPAAPVAPVVTGASISGMVGKPLSFTVSASAANPLSFSMLGAPAGMSIAATGVVNWTAPVAGSYAVTMVARNTVSGLTGQAVYKIVIAPQPAPVVAAGAVTGKVGTALAFTVSVTAPNPVSYTLAGAPAGMSISSAGLVSWAAPLAGKYAVTVTAKDSKTGLSGKGIYTVAIAAPLPPVVTAASVTGKPGVALSFASTVVAPNPVTYTLSGAPAGMAISAAGVVSWAKPVLGTYSVTIIAKDSKTGLSGQAVTTVKIAAAGPTITAAAMKGVAGKAMSGSIVLTAPGATSLRISIDGAPLGMQFSMSGLTITATWPQPVAGSYTLKVVALDNNGLTAQLNVPVNVTAK